MKPNTSKFAVWSLPVLALISICSLTYATSAPTPDRDKDKSKLKVNKTKFAHDSEIDTYLTSVRSFMLIPPRDGKFGAGRVPTLHGTVGMSVPGYESVKNLANANYLFVSFVSGRQPEDIVNSYMANVEKGRMKKEDVRRYRITPVHRVFPTDPKEMQAINLYSKEIYKMVTATDDLCFKEDYEDYSSTFESDGRTAWIASKAVRASDKSCYSCHSNVKEGQPIGYVVGVLVKKTP